MKILRYFWYKVGKHALEGAEIPFGNQSVDRHPEIIVPYFVDCRVHWQPGLTARGPDPYIKGHPELRHAGTDLAGLQPRAAEGIRAMHAIPGVGGVRADQVQPVRPAGVQLHPVPDHPATPPPA